MVRRTIKIHFVCNWGNTHQKLVKQYKFYTPNHDGVWGILKEEPDINKADCIVVLDYWPKGFTRPNKPTIFLQREPPEVIKPKFSKDKAIFKGSYDNWHQAAAWWIHLPFKELESLPIPTKSRNVSFITTNKRRTTGHRLRLALAKRLAKAVDVYGKGMGNEGLGAAYKGVLKDDSRCKLKGLYDYKYSVAIENCCLRNYFTEKIHDCILSWATPIYWGCPNIGDYFPDESYVSINAKKCSVGDIKQILEQPVNYEALKEARNLILYKYNMWACIEAIIKKYY